MYRAATWTRPVSDRSHGPGTRLGWSFLALVDVEILSIITHPSHSRGGSVAERRICSPKIRGSIPVHDFCLLNTWLFMNSL